LSHNPIVHGNRYYMTVFVVEVFVSVSHYGTTEVLRVLLPIRFCTTVEGTPTD
jgi:hypothetical protein